MEAAEVSRCRDQPSRGSGFFWFDVAAELVPHRRQDFTSEVFLVARAEPGIERRILKVIEERDKVASFSLWDKLRLQTLPAFTLQLASALAVTAALVVIAFHEGSGAHEVSVHPPALAVRLKSSAETITPPVAISARRPTSRVSRKQVRTVAVVPQLPHPLEPYFLQVGLIRFRAIRRSHFDRPTAG